MIQEEFVDVVNEFDEVVGSFSKSEALKRKAFEECGLNE